MRTATKTSAYALALAAVFGGAWALGTAVGPLGTAPAAEAMSGMPEGEQGHDATLPGLASAANGYRLVLAGAEPFALRVVDARGAAVTDFAVEHEKRLHLVLVRRDGAGYQHLHPVMAPDGTWRTPLTVPAGGTYRAFADFTPAGGTRTVLGADFQVPGAFQPLADGPAVTSASADGYRVTLHGDLAAGVESTIVATITRGGVPVTDLQPYLGANGHLVVLRATDLGYLHVHPLASAAAGPEVRFTAELPTPGRYRLYLDFRHDGGVHTAQFTVDTQDAREEQHR